MTTSQRRLYVHHATAVNAWKRHEDCGGYLGQRILWQGCDFSKMEPSRRFLRSVLPTSFNFDPPGGLIASRPVNGWSNIVIPGNLSLQ